MATHDPIAGCAVGKRKGQLKRTGTEHESANRPRAAEPHATIIFPRVPDLPPQQVPNRTVKNQKVNTYARQYSVLSVGDILRYYTFKLWSTFSYYSTLPALKYHGHHRLLTVSHLSGLCRREASSCCFLVCL